MFTLVAATTLNESHRSSICPLRRSITGAQHQKKNKERGRNVSGCLERSSASEPASAVFFPQKNISSSQFQVRRARTSAAFTLKRFSVINACSNKSGGTFWKRVADVRAGGGEDSRFCSGKDVLFISV